MPWWIALPAGMLLLGVIVYGFRQGMAVPPDPNNRNDIPPGATGA